MYWIMDFVIVFGIIGGIAGFFGILFEDRLKAFENKLFKKIKNAIKNGLLRN